MSALRYRRGALRSAVDSGSPKFRDLSH